jgi:hypothetical protein
MKRNILQTLPLVLFLICFGSVKAQGNMEDDFFAYVNTVSTPATSTASPDRIRVSDLSPSPSNASTSVNIRSLNPVTMKIRYYSITGDLVKEEAASLNSGLNHVSLDLNDMAKGIYIVQFYSKEGSAVRKIFKTE